MIFAYTMILVLIVGQVGETECWTNWFISEKEWLREKKLNELGI